MAVMLEERRIDVHHTEIVEKPWGRFRQYTEGEPCTVKIIEVNCGQVLSLQSHVHRDELWVILDDGVEVQIEDEVFHPSVGEEIRIPRGVRHRLGSVFGMVRVLEIAFGDFDEDDIVRYEDRYGRA